MPVPVPVKPIVPPGGIQAYYQSKIESTELTINEKTQNLRRLEAQRNALNARGMDVEPLLCSSSKTIAI